MRYLWLLVVLGVFQNSSGARLETGPEWLGDSEELLDIHPRSVRTISFRPGVEDFKLIPIPQIDSLIGHDEGEGNEIWSFTDPNGVTSNVAISGDGAWVAIGYSLNDQRLELRNGENGELVFEFMLGGGSGEVDISTDGKIIACAGRDSVYLFRNDASGIPNFRFGVEGYVPMLVRLSEDGEYFLVAAIDLAGEINRAWCFRNSENDPVWTFELPTDEAYGWYGAQFAVENSLVLINGKYRFYLLDLETGEKLWEANTYNTESPVRMSADGSLIVVASLTGVLTVYTRETEDFSYGELWRYRFTGSRSAWVTGCAISADGSTIAAGSLDFLEEGYDGRLALFDTHRGSQPLWISGPLGDEVSDVAINSDGSIIAAASWGDVANLQPDLYLFEKHSREPFYTLSTEGSLREVALSEDSRRLITGGKGTHSRVFGRGGTVRAVAVSQPGVIISGSIETEAGEPLETVLISIEGNPYTATTDSEGEYGILVEIDGLWEVEIMASKPGYFDIFRHVSISGLTRRDTLRDIDFQMLSAPPAPQNIQASRGRRNHISISWDPYNESANTTFNNQSSVVKAAAGGVSASINLTPWDIITETRATQVQQADNINLYRSFYPGGPYSLKAVLPGDDSLYHDRTNLIPDQKYYYVLTADFWDGESAFSEEVSGWLDESVLNWEASLESMPVLPTIDGSIEQSEWEGSMLRDVSDIYGYDEQDSAGSVEVRIGFSDESDMLYLGFSYYDAEELQDKTGVGVYIDDNGSGGWNLERPGSEGNYWGYWIEGGPDLRFRSLSGPPNNVDPYYTFENPELAFSDAKGYVEIEMALSFGFRNLHDIGLFNPDYDIGLGLFATQRNEQDAAIFNGWWPQDMFSIVSFPSQYARIHIPAELIVPPVEAREFELNRYADSLLITWSDPDSGIDNDWISEIDGINVYRNGEFFADVNSGVQRFLDNEALPFGWYEYYLAGYVIDEQGILEGLSTSPLGTYAGETPETVGIAYDDSTVEARYVVSFTGETNRFAAKFDLNELGDTVAVYNVSFYAGSIGRLHVYVTKDNDGKPGEMIGQKYLLKTVRRDSLHLFRFPGLDQPVVIRETDLVHDCWVVLEYLADQPGAPSIGMDDSYTDGERNMFFQDDSIGWQQFVNGQLMIRIAVGLPPPLIPIDEDEVLPETFKVSQNYPNPFNSASLVDVDLPERSRLSWELFDIDGRKVLHRQLGNLDPGSHLITLSSETLSNGVYFLRIATAKHQKIMKISVVR